MKLAILYGAKGQILAAAPSESPKRQNFARYPRPVPMDGQKVAEIEVGDEFSDMAYLAERCRTLRVDTAGVEPILRTISESDTSA
ncbi:MAG: hypothetical protein A4E53_03274 [Pelotomaculum sp. PtaB.Bin104]|nr:MAG: hypothetical protein A4E53_03274 [Pelotomaculum sp. PtaB.Bin104]